MKKPLSLLAASALTLLVACAEADEPSSGGAGGGGGASSRSTGASTSIDGATSGSGDVPSGIAPRGVVAGERDADDGANAVAASPGADDVLRLDLGPTDHAGLFLSFDGGDPVLELSRWDGAEAVVLGLTDGGAGLRTLAAFDGAGPRTFWVRVKSSEVAFDGTLTITRTPFADGESCTSDCDRLLQLPMRNDPAFDGYDWTPATIFRYQFGRRDLLMFTRHAARQMAIAGRSPILPADFSQWDGETPGNDVGAPRHVSHQRGKDVDLSLYGDDGLAIWRSFCDAAQTSEGRECVDGSAQGFDGRANAELFGGFLQSGRVTMSFLDRELIPLVEDGAAQASGDDALDASLLPLYSDGKHLQHWPNHDNHIHVRVSEDPYDGSALTLPPFEAP